MRTRDPEYFHVRSRVEMRAILYFFAHSIFCFVIFPYILRTFEFVVIIDAYYALLVVFLYFVIIGTYSYHMFSRMGNQKR